MGKPSETENTSRLSRNPVVIAALITACLGCTATVTAALVNGYFDVRVTNRPIDVTPTAEATDIFAATPIGTGSNLPTPIAPSPDIPIVDTPTDTLHLNIRKPEIGELNTDIPSIWNEMDIPLTDMSSPGRIAYSGFVQAEREYRFSIYWCATNARTLNQNMESIRTSFYVNGKLLSEDYILTYYHNPEGLNCRYDVVALGGWVDNANYKLEIERHLLIEIFDGKTIYPAGIYIREINVTAR